MASTKFLPIIFMIFQGIVNKSDAALGFSSTNVASIEENTAAETLIMQVAAAGGTDPNVYTITATTPVELAGWFEIVDTDKLRIKTGATIDYEHANLPVGKTVVIELTATDDGGTTVTQDFTVTVTNVDEQPAFTLATLSAKLDTAPASTQLLALAAEDPEGDTPTFSLSAASDPHVDITAAGVITVKVGQTLADCAKIMGVKAKDSNDNEVEDYAVACIGSCMAPCDGCSGAGAITGNVLGVLTAVGVLMVLCERFH